MKKKQEMIARLRNLELSKGSPSSVSLPDYFFLSAPALKVLLSEEKNADLAEFYLSDHPLCDDEDEVTLFTAPHLRHLCKPYIAKWYVCSKVQKILLNPPVCDELIKELVTQTEPDKLIDEIREYAQQHGWAMKQ